MPDDYVGMGRLNAKVDSTRMATGEYEYTRYGFELLARHKAADIWQSDMNWCGGLSKMRWIDSLTRVSKTLIIPHGRWRGGTAHFVFSNENTPWCEMFIPWPEGCLRPFRGRKRNYARPRGNTQATT